MTTNNLLDHLNFKSTLIPTWFGKSIEEWVPLQDLFGDFFKQTLIRDVVQKLLEIENSPQYWQEAKTWPYPDSTYFQQMCKIIDDYAPDDWELEVRTFLFAYLIQHVRQWVMLNIESVYLENLQQQ